MSIYDNYPVKKSVLDYTYDMFYQISKKSRWQIEKDM